MQIDIDPLSPVPIYQQIRDRVVEAIAAGGLRAGDRLVSVRRLGGQFGINVATVSKAYDMLRGEGLIATNHKSGSLVTADPSHGPASASPWNSEGWRQRATTLLAEAVAHGTPDPDIRSAVASILDAFAAQRGITAGGAAEREGDSDE